MTSMNHSQYPLLHIDLNEDQDQHVPFSPKPNEVSSSSSSTSAFSPNLVYGYPIFNNPNQDGRSYYYQGSNPFQNQQEANTNISLGPCENPSEVKHGNYGRIKLPISRRKDGLNGNRVADEGSNSSKRMLVGLDRANCIVPETSSLQTDNNNNSTPVRVCSDCYTTKTPLWRSGPRGPKSLCNACGIRQRKARRAMAAAAAATANGSDSSAQNTTPITSKTKIPKKAGESHLPFKKRSKFISQDNRGRKELRFEDLSMIFTNKYSSFQQIFPQDEKEAAILLMALSYGLVHG